MAKTKGAAKPTSGARGRTKPTRDMYTNGAGMVPHVTYGVLRAEFSGRAHTTLAHAAARLGVGSADDGVWRPTRRYDVVSPPGSPDALTCPQALWTSYEAARLPHQRDLALSITLHLPGAGHLHEAWEEARAWALEELARSHRLPAMLVLHDPTAAGVRHDPHVHVVAAARECGPRGWGLFSSLVRDEPLRALALGWHARRTAWARGRDGAR